MTRLAIVTGLCSGQRIGDVIRMQYGGIKDGIMKFTQAKVRRGGITKDVAVPMHPFWINELAKLSRRSVTLLYERSSQPFKTTAAIQERLRFLMTVPAVQEVHADLAARELIAEEATSRSTVCGRTPAIIYWSAGSTTARWARFSACRRRWSDTTGSDPEL